MLLIVNCIADVEARRRFDRFTVPRLAEVLTGDYRICHLVGAGWSAADALAGHREFDRLLLSGSELSAAEELATDAALIALIRCFAEAGKPVLGICYGHQMVARALGAKCRPAAVPEFGWKRLEIVANPLFDGLQCPVTVHSRYDEVYDLPADCQVIASTQDCAVQAFQVIGRPIWGVQFHPEMGHQEGQIMLDGNLKTEPQAPALYVDELESPQQAEANLRIFENFFQVEPALKVVAQ